MNFLKRILPFAAVVAALLFILSGNAARQLQSGDNGLKVYNQYSRIGSGNEKGFYYVDYSSYGRLKYIDYETAEEFYICDKEGCEHNDKNCVSIVMPVGGSVSPVAADDGLYLIYSGSGWLATEETTPGAVVKFDVSAHRRRQVFTIPAESTISGQVAFGKNCIYAVISTVDRETKATTYSLNCYSKETGELISALPLEYESPKILSANENRLYFEATYFDSRTQTLDQGARRIFCYDTQTGNIAEEFVYTIMSTGVEMTEDTAYVLSRDNNTLEKYNFSTGEYKLLSENLCADGTAGGISAVTEQGILYFWYRNGKYEDIVYDFYNFSAGKNINIEIRWTFLDKKYTGAPEIIAENERMYLVSTGADTRPETYICMDGHEHIMQGVKYTLALIDKGDYYNSHSNYIYIK